MPGFFCFSYKSVLKYNDLFAKKTLHSFCKNISMFSEKHCNSF